MPWINNKLCTGCGDCIPICILDAIIVKDGKAEIDMGSCHRCGACHDACPENAICYGDFDSQVMGLLPPLMTSFIRRP